VRRVDDGYDGVLTLKKGDDKARIAVNERSVVRIKCNLMVVTDRIGVAIHDSARVANRQADQEAQEAEQDGRINDLEQQQQVTGPPAAAPAAPAPAAPAAGSSMADQLGQLADLHQRGVLTDDEFAAAKAKLLGT